MNASAGRAWPAGQFLRFGAVGALGFFVDAGVLLLCIESLGSGPYAGRVLSYLAAASFTWYLNRRVTFAHATHSAALPQWLRFLAANTLGGLVNYGFYALIVFTLPVAGWVPVAGVAAGSIAGLAVNFGISRRFVFGRLHAGGEPR